MKKFVLLLSALFFLAGCISPVIIKKDLPEAMTARKSSAEADSNRLVVWDGDDVGLAASGWANGGTSSTIQTLDGAGREDSVGLKWRARGKEWKGFGWNWLGWWPADGGYDVSEYTHLVFWVRAEFKEMKKMADLSAVTVRILASGNDKASSESIPLNVALKSLADKQWHEVVIPIADLIKGEGKNLDLKTVWEFGAGEWSMVDRDFTIIFDDIAFEKRVAPAGEDSGDSESIPE